MTVTSLVGLLTVREFADRESLSVSKVRSLIKQGRLPVRYIDRCVRIREVDAREFEEQLAAERAS